MPFSPILHPFLLTDLISRCDCPFPAGTYPHHLSTAINDRSLCAKRAPWCTIQQLTLLKQVHGVNFSNKKC